MLSLFFKRCQQLAIKEATVLQKRSASLVRKPLKILNDQGQEYFFQPVLSKEPPKIVKKKKITKELQAYYQNRLKKHQTKAEFDPDLLYTPINNQDAEYLTLKFQITNKKSKISKQVIILEGKRLISDAIKAGLSLTHAFFVEPKTIQDFDIFKNVIKSGASLYQITSNNMQSISECTTSPGLIAVFEKPSQFNYANLESRLPVTLIADNIRDPGNLGTLIRSSAAAGIEKILLTKGCVNAWESKVIRSSCGAHFRINIESNFDWNSLADHLPSSMYSLFIANVDSKSASNLEEQKEAEENEIEDHLEENNNHPFNSKVVKSNDLKNILYSDVNYFEGGERKNIGLIVGGETHGVSQEAYDRISEYHGSEINIPIENNVNSLNSAIAASIVLFEIKRQFKSYC